MSAIVERFDRIRRNTPDRPLIHEAAAARTWTAADVWEAAAAQASALRRRGFDGDRLIVSTAGNAVGGVVLWLASRMTNVTLMPVDAGTKRAEVDALADRFGASAVVSSPTTRGATDAPDRATEPFPARLALRPCHGLARPELYRGAAALKLTSGSTGVPKATFTTEEVLVADSEHIVAAMDIGPDDCQLAAIPLSHAYGIGNLVVPIFLQGTAVVLRDGFVPHQFRADVTTYGVRVFPGVPFMFDHLAVQLPARGWPAGLERLISAGARLEPATVGAVRDAFGVKIHSFYGTSETGGIAFDDTPHFDEQPTVGRVMPGVQVTLRAEEGAPVGGGRVHVSGAAVASGYVGVDGAAEGFVDGGFLTGDFGRFDDRPHLILTGRVSSFVNVTGRKVQPEEVEQVLRSMPDVADVRVLGTTDPSRGERIVACIVWRATDPGALAVRQYCAARLPPYKIPRTILSVDQIPLTERGKTDRVALASLVQSRLRAQPAGS